MFGSYRALHAIDAAHADECCLCLVSRRLPSCTESLGYVISTVG
ncbi:hypothetical protein T261_5690 [Streptomyces lydicus]|nr:hypothetical protein T261_5690 [Streptomyces lydicus]